jgi:tetratricopeptide (TPR) repeat protein
MTTPLQTPNAIPIQVPDEAGSKAASAAAAGRARLRKRILLGLIILVATFVITYIIAWYNANQLATRFFQDSENSYNAGDYLNAMVGFQKFDDQTNQYVNYGGYLNVAKIWSSPYSWPMPSYVQKAVERSKEIISAKLTVEQAETYILENTGRPGTPYFAEIYLRLGELYEQNGDIEDAIDVYQSYASQFPDRKDLIEQAQQHLENLQSQN